MQQVLGFSALEAGLAWLGFFVGIFFGFSTGTKLMLRFGVRPVIVAGLLTAAAGMVLLSGVSVGGSYISDLLPGMLVFGVGLGWGYVPVSVSVMADTDESEAGLAAGLLGVGQQIGGALGIAVLVALADTRTDGLVDSGVSAASAQVEGAQLAWLVGAALCVAAAGAAAWLIGHLRPESVSPPVPMAAADESADHLMR
jgi:MFS family permease